MKKPAHPIVSWTVALTVLVAVLLLTGYVQQPTTLNLVKQRGELVIVTHISPTTYFVGPEGDTGFEYDLAKEFADYLGVKLKVVSVDSFNRIIPTLLNKQADIAAAGLTITKSRERYVRFGPSYQQVKQQLIYRKNHRPMPTEVDDIDGYIEVVAGSSHAETLRSLAKTRPFLDWEENYQADIDGLLSLVWQKELDYTIADSNQIDISRRYFPELGIAFDVSEAEDIAWAFPKNDDFSLYREAQRFFEQYKESGQLALLKEQHFGHIGEFDYVDTRVFLKHMHRRLGQYQSDYQQAGVKHQQDWRLLAAIGYQESHWNPKAVSPTGVRGIMMLTRRTAAEMGISNRVNPRSSIRGGSRYFALMKKSVDKSITGADRTWFALASYNLGLGHVNDARLITKQLGGNPNKWMDVSNSLPLLMQKRWYKQTRYGYARGMEAMKYVENIRNYYDILVWRTENSSKTAATLLVKYQADTKEHGQLIAPIL